MILVENQMDICLAKHDSSHKSRKVSNYIEQCGLKLYDTWKGDVRIIYNRMDARGWGMK